MTLRNRSELLFLYDVTFANPNGDPLDSNKPRIDEETGKNIVTDVRLKRTVRDYLNEYLGEEIFIREISDDEGIIQDAKLRASDFLEKDGKRIKESEVTMAEMKKIIQGNILSKCIDVRLFGATIPVEKDKKDKGSITLTGPVQFKMGQSLHKVKLQYIKGTGAFAGQQGATQKTFREEYILPYSLIAFHGIINENAGAITNLSQEDIDKLVKALWLGTKNLISRSKFGQQPRLLLRIIYKEKNFFIGELDKLISFKSEKVDEEIRDISEGILEIDQLIIKLKENKEKIEKVELIKDSRTALNIDLQKSLEDAGITIKEIQL